MRLTREAVLTGLLLGAVTLAPLMASAQPTPAPNGATTTVDIKQGDQKKPAAAPAAKEPPVNVPKKAVSNRDPFVNETLGGGGTINKKVEGSKAGALKTKDPKAAKNDKVAAAPAPEIPPPQVTVQGILLSGTGNRAILQSPNQTYIVRTGDKLGDYKVDSVQNKYVVFRFKDKTFKLKLKDEFATVAGGPKAGSSSKKK